MLYCVCVICVCLSLCLPLCLCVSSLVLPVLCLCGLVLFCLLLGVCSSYSSGFVFFVICRLMCVLMLFVLSFVAYSLCFRNLIVLLLCYVCGSCDTVALCVCVCVWCVLVSFTN